VARHLENVAAVVLAGGAVFTVARLLALQQ